MIIQIDSWVVRNTKIPFVFANGKIDGRKSSDLRNTRDLVYTSSLLQDGAVAFTFLLCFLLELHDLSAPSIFSLLKNIFFPRSIHLKLYSHPEMILSVITLEKSMAY